MRRARELNRRFAGTHLAQLGQAGRECCQVNRPAVTRNLHGVAAADPCGSRRPRPEAGKPPLAASHAPRLWHCGVQYGPFASPDIDRDQFPSHGLGAPGKYFERLRHLHGSDQRRDRVEHADGVTCRLAGLRRIAEDAFQAGGLAGYDGHDRAVRADRRAIDPWDAVLDRDLVDQKARLVIVGAVKDDVD